MSRSIGTVLAVDVGGTNIRAATVSEQGLISAEQEYRFKLGERSVSEELLLKRLTSLFSGIIRDHGSITAVGIGFPGFFIGDSGVLASSPNLPELKNVRLAERLSESLKLPVRVQNDALCAAIGEHRFGAGRGVANLLHITLGTGIGGGLILNNVPYGGEGGMAMEFGHLRVERGDDARSCGCGGRGCVEAYASATAVARRYAELSGREMGAREIFGRAENGDRDAASVITSAGGHLGMAMAEALKLLDIRTVTVSGGLVGGWPLLHPAIMQSLEEGLIPPLRGKISVLKSALDDTAGLLGAATLVCGK